MTDDDLRDPEMDALFGRLKAPAPPLHPPAIVVPLYRRRWIQGAALAAALLLSVVGARQLQEPLVTARGAGAADGAAAPTVELRLVVERDGEAKRLAQRELCAVGEVVYFRVAASEAAALSVEGPSGIEAIAAVDASDGVADVSGPDGLVGYRFDEPGPHTFILISGPSVHRWTVDVTTN